MTHACRLCVLEGIIVGPQSGKIITAILSERTCNAKPMAELKDAKRPGSQAEAQA